MSATAETAPATAETAAELTVEPRARPRAGSVGEALSAFDKQFFLCNCHACA
jgi:hypothetical protein